MTGHLEGRYIRHIGDKTPLLPCRRCGHPSVHSVLAKHTQLRSGVKSPNYEGVVEDAWVIARCDQCGTTALLTRFWSSFDEYAMLARMESWMGHQEAWHWTIMGEDGCSDPVVGLPLPLTRVVAWNIRHGGCRRIDDILARIVRHRPDILVLTEFRDDRSGQQLRGGLEDIGLWYSDFIPAPEKANGVLIAAREYVSDVRPLAPNLERPHMLLEGQAAGIGVVGVYMPNGDAKTPYWEAVVTAAKERVGQPTLFIGDFNTGKHHVDEAGATLVSAPFMDRMESVGFTELWRCRNPDVREFTWISNAGNGFRLDHAFASPCLAERVADVFYSHAERTDGISDHSMLIVDVRGAA